MAEAGWSTSAMKTFKNIMTVVIGLASVAVLGVLFAAIWHADTLIVNLTPKKALDVEGINGLVPKVNTLLTSVQTGVDVAAWKINGDGGSPDHPHTGPYDGILTQLYKNEKTIHKTIFDAQTEQLKLYAQLNQDSPALFLKLNSSAGHLDDTLKELPSAVVEARTTITNIGALVVTLNQMGLDIDSNLIKDPEVKESLAQVAGLLAELHLTTQDVRLIMDKFQRDYTAPRTKKGWALVVLRSIVELGAKGAEFKVFLGK
jgi:hypothetical protein